MSGLLLTKHLAGSAVSYISGGAQSSGLVGHEWCRASLWAVRLSAPGSGSLLPLPGPTCLDRASCAETRSWHPAPPLPGPTCWHYCLHARKGPVCQDGPWHPAPGLGPMLSFAPDLEYRLMLTDPWAYPPVWKFGSRAAATATPLPTFWICEEPSRPDDMVLGAGSGLWTRG